MSIDTSGMVPEATELTNVLARELGNLSAEDLRALREDVMRRAVRKKE